MTAALRLAYVSCIPLITSKHSAVATLKFHGTNHDGHCCIMHEVLLRIIVWSTYLPQRIVYSEWHHCWRCCSIIFCGRIDCTCGIVICTITRVSEPGSKIYYPVPKTGTRYFKVSSLDDIRCLSRSICSCYFASQQLKNFLQYRVFCAYTNGKMWLCEPWILQILKSNDSVTCNQRIVPSNFTVMTSFYRIISRI
jgi:hypothetical protein